MANQILFHVLQKPLLTEKSTWLKDNQNKVLVEVAKWANKHQIAEATKLMFNVNVKDVHTLNRRGKVKRVRQFFGKQKNTKLAYLTLAQGADVDLFGLVGQAPDDIKEK